MMPKAGRNAMSRGSCVLVATVLVTIGLAACCQTVRRDAGPKAFVSPREAVAGLVSAVQADSDAELLAILGNDAEDLVRSGDAVADQNGRALFLRAYARKHGLAREGEGRMVLQVGERDFPFPVPIVRQGDAWRFDTQAGREEILNRRIGRNELHTIEVMYAYIEAQRAYAAFRRNGAGPAAFARRFASSTGQRDGLYWEAEPGEAESPLGPLIARAVEEGYEGDFEGEVPEPFHGYYFKILTAQGEHAAGGAFNYLADGSMVLGFALVAYPARYGVSGIMTFMVNQQGVIHEKDLGEDTARKAAAMAVFDPDDTWRRYAAPAG
jgi:hypothetical protein